MELLLTSYPMDSGISMYMSTVRIMWERTTHVSPALRVCKSVRNERAEQRKSRTKEQNKRKLDAMVVYLSMLYRSTRKKKEKGRVELVGSLGSPRYVHVLGGSSVECVCPMDGIAVSWSVVMMVQQSIDARGVLLLYGSRSLGLPPCCCLLSFPSILACYVVVVCLSSTRPAAAPQAARAPELCARPASR